MEYLDFIKNKSIKTKTYGIDVDVDQLNSKLFDFQKFCVKKALHHRVFCLFEECGLGKTLQQLEWAFNVVTKTGGNVLIVAPLCVTKQTALEEAPKLGYQVTICKKQADVKKGINITNYEMLDHFNCDEFVGVVLDESSILKNYTGSTRTKLKKYFSNTEYKLCCTATPAPNDLMELLNHADFLGVMSTAQALSNYFINDFKTGDWRLKGHATRDFYRWCCSWSINIDTPSDIGFDDSLYVLPKLNEQIIIVDTFNDEINIDDGLFGNINMSATGYHKEKKRTAKDRAKQCAAIIEKHCDEQFIIWCDTNYEADWLIHYIPEATEVRGDNKPREKEDATIRFKNGEIRILISKATIFGYGMNFQKCHNVIFCGLTYSYENYYQALRRIYRFGQINEVNSWIVLGSTEKNILNVINRKKKNQERLKNSMDTSVKQIQLIELKEREVDEVVSEKIEQPSFL
ncbi:MAG: SNF2-related protein [Candidatus Izemoplasmatales bacterium]|nr:SNF2-related protein [Candidatus Izemoplasmatales bacterium]